MLFDFIKRFWLLNPTMPFFVGGGGSAARYQLTKSLRLRAGVSASLARSAGLGGSATTQKAAVSCWVKFGLLSAADVHLINGYDGANYLAVLLNSSAGVGNSIRVVNQAATLDVRTSAMFRDPTAHYHVFILLDGTQAAGSRCKIYVNGVLQSLSTNTDSATAYYIGGAYSHRIGTNVTGAGNFFDGHLSDLHLTIGQTNAVTDFGEFNPDGVWVPKPYAGAYGTSGVHLDFKDVAATVASNVGLGKDTSGNALYWATGAGISVTPGATYDSMTDTPTNNYATLNNIWPVAAGVSFGSGNLDFNRTTSPGTWASIPTTIPITAGKFYVEKSVSTGAAGINDGSILGVSKLSAFPTSGYLSSATADHVGTYNSTGSANIYVNTTLTGITAAAGDMHLACIDVDAGKAWVGYYDASVPSTTWYNSAGGTTGDPATGANPTLAFTAGTPMVFGVSVYGVGTTTSLNCGQRAFTATPPTGFKALCTANLPAVAITNPKKYFDAKTRVGTAAAYSVTGIGFRPDFVWAKSKGRILDHALYDSVRGVEKRLESNNAEAEVTGDTTGLTAFNSDGYSGGALDQINGTTATNSFIDWMWKAGGAAVTNTAGTISAQVSANTTAGFSIATYTATNTAGQTVGHGLGVAPAMVIIKNRQGATNAWVIWHKGLAATELLLFSTAVKAADSNSWDGGAFGATTFKVGNASALYDTNLTTGGGQHVAYCFAEVPGYSKFGTYTGNGAADGPVVHCGFRPRFILVKRTDAIESWYMYDTARNTYNVMDLRLIAEGAASEASVVRFDAVATGFKLRTLEAGSNASGGSYIFAAFAENPFGGSNVAPSPAR